MTGPSRRRSSPAPWSTPPATPPPSSISTSARRTRASRRSQAAVAGEPRIRLVAKRAAGAWGSFGLVEAPLNALAQIEAEGVEPDYVMLLSGACLPCRPVASLERFLVERDGGEFIESEDESWITGGWRAERWRFWHWFDHKTQRPLEAALGPDPEISRRPPQLPRRARAALRLAVVDALLAGAPGDPRRHPPPAEAPRLLPHRLDPRRDGVPDLRQRVGAARGDRRLRAHPLPVHQPRQADRLPRRPRRLRAGPRALLRAQGLAGGARPCAPPASPRRRRRTTAARSGHLTPAGTTTS